ncbi:leucine-rich repeat domain-containing protein [Flavobacterium branchiicola]|uniref:Two component regulator three Y domain protein n=1 Tax=Flavobacterium branchiicola TaxID=1114875 RepID=A0ABV9PAV1_9FLAO|nr:Two component regulator three Y domain protein [Flavobacterium branchiicola]MBS7252454.1 Two component regulator three Y domain protein [Flavobacterium branchiicola]
MKSVITFFLIFAFSCNCLADAVSDKEKEALIKLYYTTNGANWKIKWDLSQSVSTWYGVRAENGKVVALNLADNNLEGELPATFCDLVYLIEVDLHKNKLQGQLPEEIGKLSQLETLALFNNEIEGSLPASFYSITTLKVLLLNSNKLSGSLSNEVENFKALQNFSLFDNRFEGEIPAELEKLHNLSEMNLSYNKFKGSVSKSLTILDSLNMTMFDENGNPFLLEVNEEKEPANITVN